MKTIPSLLLLVMVAAFCCPAGHAQIIYSNNFALGGTVNISNTPPTLATDYAGGTNIATWNDVLGINDTGSLLANGIDDSASPTSWLLPFTPQSGYIYLMTVTVAFTNNPGNWIGAGFAQNFPSNLTVGYGRFADSPVNGYDFAILTEGTGNVQYFAGPHATATIANQNGIFPPGPGTNTLEIMLNTENSPWSMAAYVNGVQAGTYSTYSANPTIRAVGLTQTALSAPNSVQWINFALTTTLRPFILQEPTPAQITLGGGSLYTNLVKVMADTNGGTLSYQWYANGMPLTNGVNNVSGANTNLLVINPVATANQITNYYVIVTNNYGSVTSSLASLTVLTNPVVTVPTSLSNSITLFAGASSNLGSSPKFSVKAIGAPVLTYQWLTNGVAVGGATNDSIEFTNCQLSSPTNYTCVVSNSFGETNIAWFATYETAPTAAYPQAVLGDQPLDLWRLNESDDLNGNEGAVCHDYQSGANGVYTNVSLGQMGYNASEPAETSMYVTAGGLQPSCVSRIDNVDLAATMTNGVNAAFAVEAWANCISANGASGGAPVVSQGVISNLSSFFLGVDTNSSTKHYQFYVRSANGAFYSADDTTIQANDLNWHYLVGVCDEAHTNISLYIDGNLVASAYIPAQSGNFESGMPVAIGAGIRTGASDYNVPFTGNIDDVAIYNHALSIGQVINHYVAAGGSVPVSFVPALPPANVTFLANQPLAIAATVAGSAPLGYYWTDVTTGSVLGSGQTNVSGSLNATLTVPDASASLSGDQLELTVTNGTSSANLFVTLFSPAPPVTLDYSSPILYSNDFNGGTWSIAGMPLTAANSLVGGTNATWIDADGTNNTGLMEASGVDATTMADSWLVPFTPHAGYIYTESVAVTFSGYPGSWTGPGFAELTATNVANGAFNHNVTGYNWPILTESSGNIQYFPGPGTTGGAVTNATLFTSGPGTHTVQMVLDATGAKWNYNMIIDGKSSIIYTYKTNPTNINAVGFQQNALGSPGFVQWNNFSLTQVAPGGVPPYLLEPQPPTSLVLTNGTLTIPATAFGSAPLGYYWVNNSTVIASGLTNNMAPLPASLGIASSSLTAGELDLIVTNAYGTNITLITLAPLINPNPTNIVFSVTDGQMTLSWPADRTGWTLQAQTNALSTGLNTNWVDLTDSTSTNQMVIPVNPNNGSVFYRLILH